jgi:hypothetical protein
MPDTEQLLRGTRDRIVPPDDVLGGLERRRRHHENVKRLGAAAVALVIALVGLGGWFALGRDPAPRLGDRSEDRSEQLGIFAPVGGRILYVNEGFDHGYEPGIWAVDPDGPGDTERGARVADDVVSTLVGLDVGDAEPLGWSGDGTELLMLRTVDGSGQYLSVLHADGSETRLNPEPMAFEGAAISSDGTRVAYASGGLYVVGADGGVPVRIAKAAGSPTFSPDGARVAYLVDGYDEQHVWVANADGTGAHEILADEPIVLAGATGLQWSPAGDLLAIELDQGEDGRRPGIYTFAPDGSDLTWAVDGGVAPFWSPDGSRIAFTIPCDEHPDRRCAKGSELRTRWAPAVGDPQAGLAIVNMGNLSFQAFGFAASGPWHPLHGWVGDGALPPASEGEVFDRIAQGESVIGWPTTGRNHGGIYSFDGSTCGVVPGSSCSMSPEGAWMHNGYGSGAVNIYLQVLPEAASGGEGAAVPFLGHVGRYRRIDDRREGWVVDLAGSTIFIRLRAEPGASRADIADAHAIVDSMRVEPMDSYLGFRIVFILTNNDWDSG